MDKETYEMMKDQTTFLMEMMRKQNEENERAMAASQRLYERQINFQRKAKGLPPITLDEVSDEHNGSD